MFCKRPWQWIRAKPPCGVDRPNHRRNVAHDVFAEHGRRQVRLGAVLRSEDPPQPAGQPPANLGRPRLDPPRHLFQEPMEQARLAEGQDSVVLHAEKRRRRAERVFGIDHHDAPLPQRGFLGLQRRDVDALSERLVRYLQVDFHVGGVFEQVLGRPNGGDIALAHCRLRHRPPGNIQGRRRDRGNRRARRSRRERTPATPPNLPNRLDRRTLPAPGSSCESGPCALRPAATTAASRAHCRRCTRPGPPDRP